MGLSKPHGSTGSARMSDDDRVLVNTQLVLHEGQPDGAENRNYYHCSSPSVSNLRAVIGSGMFSRRQVNPGISFSRLAAQPYLSIMDLDYQFLFSSKSKSQKHQFLISYQLDRRTSPEPLPGTITALLTGLIIKQKLYSMNCVALYC